MNMEDSFLFYHLSTHMDEITKDKLNTELKPILKNVFRLRSGNYGDPAVGQLFNWLVDPQRTVEEFNYVVGPLGKIVLPGWEDFNYFVGPLEKIILPSWHHPYLGLAAAEALAVKSPLLVGPWEHAAFLVVNLISPFPKQYNNEVFSDRLIDWIIRMMGDPNLCPNPYLLLEFLNMFDTNVCTDTRKKAQAFKVVMFTCSDLNRFSDFSPLIITHILGKFTDDGYLQDFDQQLSNRLLTQISDIQRFILHDIACSYALNPNRITGSYELNIVIGLFQYTSECAQQYLQKFQEDLDYNNLEASIISISHALRFLLNNFMKSCHTPQLVDVTASCIMDVLELVLLVNIALMTDRSEVNSEYEPEDFLSLYITDKLLEELCDYNNYLTVADSPVGQAMYSRYQGRLIYLRQKLENLNIHCYVMICSL